MSKSMGMVPALAFLALAMIVPDLAFAQGGFNEAGASGWAAVCEFLKSPVVTFIVAAVIIGLLIAMMSNEENKLVGRMLQILVGVSVILALPGLLTMLGLPVPGGC